MNFYTFYVKITIGGGVWGEIIWSVSCGNGIMAATEIPAQSCLFEPSFTNLVFCLFLHS